MRVIAGKARRIQLKTIEGMNTRPTTDRIKETLFNIIGNEMYDCRFLDLFSGSGGIGIEALSRGAKEAYFVENGKDAVRCIRENLEKTKLLSQSHVMESDVIDAIRKLNDREEQPFDFIYMDPPYGKLLEREVLKALAGTCLADEYTTIIIEASKETEFDYAYDLGYCIDRIKDYKTNRHVFMSVKQKA